MTFFSYDFSNIGVLIIMFLIFNSIIWVFFSLSNNLKVLLCLFHFFLVLIALISLLDFINMGPFYKFFNPIQITETYEAPITPIGIIMLIEDTIPVNSSSDVYFYLKLGFALALTGLASYYGYTLFNSSTALESVTSNAEPLLSGSFDTTQTIGNIKMNTIFCESPEVFQNAVLTAVLEMPPLEGVLLRSSDKTLIVICYHDVAKAVSDLVSTTA